MGGLPVNIDILLFGNDNLSVEINTFIFSCVQKYIKDNIIENVRNIRLGHIIQVIA
jgi:hypothetical protein